MPKKIILSFDGTWNAPDNDSDAPGAKNTNVCKLHEAILPFDASGVQQAAWYDAGVGTKWYDRLRGGMFGFGLSQNIKEGYAQLLDWYEDGDQVYLFGFSRGAYTARSLVGLIRNAGLLHKGQANIDQLIERAYALYRSRDRGPDAADARLFRSQHAREIDIHFIGVWDTVGSLGVPLSSFAWFNRSFYQFHDTELSGIVKNAYQALAIDEHRKDYHATLWDPRYKPNQVIEQVWFAGAHANVGGGYANNALSDLALVWMMEKAEECGLAIGASHKPDVSRAHLAPVVDSYKEFLNGVYSLFSKRYHRPIGTTYFDTEKIHPSVILRRQQLANYRPDNHIASHLQQWA